MIGPERPVGRWIILAVLACGLTLQPACSSKKVLPSKKIDYKSATQTEPLEVPPDLTTPSSSDRYALPDAPGRGTTTFSEYAQDRPGQQQQQSGVLPQLAGAHIERGGTQRWLVVDQPPDLVWPVLREFWQEQGFIVAVDDSSIGVMETDWAENRAKIPQGALRNLIGKVFDQAYSTPEQDKFRTRIERGAKSGTTEIYVTHVGAYEMYVADANLRQTGKTMWQPRPPDPNLEAEMLSRLMLKFGVSPAVATAQVKNTKTEPRAVISKGPDGAPVLLVKDDFDRAWRRVGLSLDRLGFAVQDRNRADGLYFVKYLNPERAKEPDMLSRLAFWKSDAEGGKAQGYRIALTEAQGGTRVAVETPSGAPEKSEVAARILNVLQEDLR